MRRRKKVRENGNIRRRSTRLCQKRTKFKTISDSFNKWRSKSRYLTVREIKIPETQSRVIIYGMYDEYNVNKNVKITAIISTNKATYENSDRHFIKIT